MRTWLYYRLSRDEDEELNSLQNQRKILLDYADTKGYEIVGESFDDNVSGMHFNRDGINKIYEVVDSGKIDAVIVKDLSRLGRHKTQTALFIDYLRENNVRVLSVTENIDTSNENDDLIVGFKGIMNDYYARDISRKIRTAYRQKQKEGIVIIPPFGYFKDKNTKQIVLVEEAAETVRQIYNLYTSGHGLKSVARILNEQGRKTPAQIQLEYLNKRMPNTVPKIAYQYIWINTTVKRILTDETYTGTLVNHKTECNSINKTFRFTESSEQYKHENFLPTIIEREQWEQAQFLIGERNSKKVRAGHNQKVHRYSGLIVCGDCGRKMTGIKRTEQTVPRVEYVCDSYHRYSIKKCTSHRIHEDFIDKLLFSELLSWKKYFEQNWAEVEKSMANWDKTQRKADKHIRRLEEKVVTLEREIENILMERMKDKPNATRYDKMIKKREQNTAQAKTEIVAYQNMEEVIGRKKVELKKNIDLLDTIIANGSINEAHLRMLIEQITITDVAGKLQIDFQIRAPFRGHTDWYDEMLNVVDRANEIEFDMERLPVHLEDIDWGDGEEQA